VVLHALTKSPLVATRWPTAIVAGLTLPSSYACRGARLRLLSGAGCQSKISSGHVEEFLGRCVALLGVPVVGLGPRQRLARWPLCRRQRLFAQGWSLQKQSNQRSLPEALGEIRRATVVNPADPAVDTYVAPVLLHIKNLDGLPRRNLSDHPRRRPALRTKFARRTGLRHGRHLWHRHRNGRSSRHNHGGRDGWSWSLRWRRRTQSHQTKNRSENEQHKQSCGRGCTSPTTGPEKAIDAECRSVVDPVVRSLLGIRDPSPAAGGLEPERMPDDPFQRSSRGDPLLQRRCPQTEFHPAPSRNCLADLPAGQTGIVATRECGRGSAHARRAKRHVVRVPAFVTLFVSPPRGYLSRLEPVSRELPQVAYDLPTGTRPAPGAQCPRLLGWTARDRQAPDRDQMRAGRSPVERMDRPMLYQRSQRREWKRKARRDVAKVRPMIIFDAGIAGQRVELLGRRAP